MILLDSNALVVLLVGLIDPGMVGKHRRTSIYDEEDFNKLLGLIGSFDEVVVLPNIWTEVDNLLNSFGGALKYQYVKAVSDIIKATSETYIESKKGCEFPAFFELGLTDSLILEHAKTCRLLVTGDTALADYARAYGIQVYDLVKLKNEKLRKS